MRDSAFSPVFQNREFVDRLVNTGEKGIDVIVPIYNTNLLFEENLQSWYRTIPIHRLLVGDGGSQDDSREILDNYPRVEIINQSKYTGGTGALGVCIAELISLVETDWFVYLHSDVFLTEGWYEEMVRYQGKYDFYESSRDILEISCYKHDIDTSARSYSGSQMGRTAIFKDIHPIIEDGYMFRNEDLIFQDLVQKRGFRYGRVTSAKHIHENIRIGKETPHSRAALQKTYHIQARGIIKYCLPDQPLLVGSVNGSLAILADNDLVDLKKFRAWVQSVNPDWLEYINWRRLKFQPFRRFLLKLRKVINFIFYKMLE